MAFSKAFVAVFVALGALGANAGPCIPRSSLSSSLTLTATSSETSWTSSETLASSSTETFTETSTGTTTALTDMSSSTTEATSSEASLSSSETLVTSSTGTTTALTDTSSSTLATVSSTGTLETLTSATSAAELSSTLETSSTAVSTATTSQGPIRTQECAVLGGAGHDLSQDKLAEVKIDAYDDKTLDECLAICASQRDCATLAHNPTQNRCETWKGTLEQIGVEDTPRAEWYYYSTSCLANDRKDTCARPGWGLDGDENTSRTKIGKFPNYDNYASCYAFCEETGGCAMFAFNPVEQLCELWSGSFEQAKFKPVFRASWTFYRLDCLEPEGGAN